MEIIPFFKKIPELKELKRTGWRMEGIDGESVADHSFSLALMALVYSRRLGLDSGKCTRMALIHDLCEVYSKDIPRRSESGEWQQDAAWKLKAEEEGMKKVLGLLPPGLSKELGSLWNEYNERKTPEAKLVRDLDRLECCMQALHYARQGKGRDLSHFFEDGDRDIKTPEIRKAFGKLSGDFRNLKRTIK